MDFKALNAAESNRQSSNKAISEASGKGHGQEKREAVVGRLHSSEHVSSLDCDSLKKTGYM